MNGLQLDARDAAIREKRRGPQRVRPRPIRRLVVPVEDDHITVPGRMNRPGEQITEAVEGHAIGGITFDHEEAAC